MRRDGRLLLKLGLGERSDDPLPARQIRLNAGLKSQRLLRRFTGKIFSATNPKHPSLFSLGLGRVFEGPTSAEDDPRFDEVCRSLIFHGVVGLLGLRARRVQSEDGLRGGFLPRVMRVVYQRNAEVGCCDCRVGCLGE